MKKLMASFALVTTLFACQSKTETAATSNYPSNATGYNIDSSANIETVKKALTAGLSYDTATTKTLYVDTATVWDNKTKQTLAQNMQIAGFFKSKGAVIKLERIENIWESVRNKQDVDGSQSYVHVYMTVSVTRGDKKIEAIMNAVFAFNNGKIIQEWDLYDTSEIMELLK